MLARIIIILFFPLFSYSQNWNIATQFPYAGVHHPITFSYDNYGFVISGSNTDNTFRYDKNTDSWTQLANFPGGDRGYAYGVAKDNKAYMGFGSDPSGNFPNDWWEYDITNDSWYQLASFPGAGRNHPAMVVVGNSVFVGCGSNTSNLNDWWEYNINTDTWTQKPDLPGNTRHHPFYFSINDFAYVGFGHGSSTGPGSNPSTGVYIFNDFYRYNPSSSSWTQLANFPSESRVAGTQFSFNGKGYIISGDGEDHSPLDEGEFWEYNPTNDSWNQLPSHPGDAIWAPGCFVLDCEIYFLLGQNTSTFPASYPLNIYSYKLSQDCGCTDSSAVNYSSIATIDDGSCCYIAGCTDPYAINFNNQACFDDGSCILPILGCTNSTATNFNPNANTNTAYGGAIDNTFSTGGYFNGNQHLIFNSSENCVISSAKFYADVNTSVTFELRNQNGTIIDDTTHFVLSGEQRLDLNFEVPVGNNLQLGVSANNSGLYRNNSGAIYPYDIGGILSITGSSASSPGYYYFYYDIKVKVPCMNSTSAVEIKNHRQIIGAIDFLGREVNQHSKKIKIIKFNDGTYKKQLIIGH